MTTVLYVEVNVICIVLLAIIAVNAMSFGYDRSMRNRMFVAMTWFMAASALLDSLWCFVGGSTALPRFVLLMLNFFYFFSLCGMCYFAFLYAQESFEKHWLRRKKRVFLCSLPMLALTVLLFCSIFTGWIFYLDENNVHCRGPLYPVQLLVAGSYLLYSTAKSFSLALRPRDYSQRGDFFAVTIFSTPLLIATGFQIFLPQVPLITAGATVSFLLLYIRTLKRMVSQDPVTGISDRRQLLLYLTSRAENLKKDEKLWFLFMDIDAFKEINDTYGHDEGDRVLRLVAGILKDMCAHSKGFCARYGGDEFAMVQVLSDSEDALAVTTVFYQLLQQRLASSPVACPVAVSIGLAEYRGSETETLQELIARADKEMYVRKTAKQRVREKQAT